MFMTIKKKMRKEHLIRRTSVRVIKFGYLCDVRLKPVYKPFKFETFELITDVISRDPYSKKQTLNTCFEVAPRLSIYETASEETG